jgi:hypothetical protein
VALPSLIQDAMRDYRGALERAMPGRIQRIVVLGSVARGEADEESDVDVLVLVDRLTFAERSRIIDQATEIGFERGCSSIRSCSSARSGRRSCGESGCSPARWSATESRHDRREPAGECAGARRAAGGGHGWASSIGWPSGTWRIATEFMQ